MKKNDVLLGSGQWYFVEIREWKDIEKVILDEEEYNTFFKGLNDEAKYIKLNDNFYFWTRIEKFWPVVFEEWVLSTIKNLDIDTQEHIRKRIKMWAKVDTMERLRFEVSLWNYNHDVTWTEKA